MRLTPVSARGRGVRLGTAALLLLGTAVALPALAEAEPVYTATGAVTAPSPVAFAARFGLTCPEPPPGQGVDVHVFALPEEVALARAPLAVTGVDAEGTAQSLTAGVYADDCTFSRFVSTSEPASGVAFPLEETDRYIAVTSDLGVATALTLTVGAPGAVAPPTPSAEPAPGGEPGSSGPVVRRDYSGGVDDPYYPEPAGLLPTDAVGDVAPGGQWGMRVIRAEQAWQEDQATGAGVKVAVLDSGLDVDHPDFACSGKVQLVPGWEDVTDLDGHGTHVAGIVGACTNNETGVVGTAPDATILPIQALSPEDATADRLARAIRAAADNGAHVINMSLGFGIAPGGLVTIPGSGSAFGLVGAFAAEIDPAIEYAVAKGVVVVAAAGNETFPLCGYPALAEDVVCVGSTDRRDVNAWYGNFPVTEVGTALMAPGGSGQLFCDVHSENVLSTYSLEAEAAEAERGEACCSYPEAGYRGLDGTSMASPHVAGVAALVYDRLGGVRSPEAAQQVISAMTSSAKDLYTPGYDPMSGEGRVDALGAVQAVTPVTTTPTPTPTVTPTEEPSPTPTETEPPAPLVTTAELVAAGSGQTTDDLPVAVRLEDEQGAVSGAQVLFRLRGDGGVRELAATTDEQGVATAVQPLDVLVGAYVLSVEYAGDDRRAGSYAEQDLLVVRDDSTTSVTTQRSGGTRTVRAVVADQDSGFGVGYASVTLLADGKEVGTATADQQGTAVFTPTGSAKNAKEYEVRFVGDDRYEASAGRATP